MSNKVPREFPINAQTINWVRYSSLKVELVNQTHLTSSVFDDAVLFLMLFILRWKLFDIKHQFMEPFWRPWIFSGAVSSEN